MALQRARGLVLAVLAVIAGVAVQRAGAAVSLRMPVIPWYSVLRGGYVDLITRQPVTTQFALAGAGPVAPGAPGTFQGQPGLLNPAPRPTSRNIFPITLPSLAFWEKCFKETDTLSALVTKCNYQDTFTTCTMLANMGYLPKGVQSFEAKSLTGSFNLPIGCASATLGVSYDKMFRVTFNSPQVPVLAVISKDPIGSMVSYFGTGTTQGRIRHRLAHKVEFCYAPTVSEISVSKSAIYSTGMTPGAASWSFAKSVELAAPYTNGRAAMFNGDSVDATWTLAANKAGADVTYQGVVSGSITINNPTPAVITVNSIIDQVTGGPAATVTCPVGTPFTVPACSFATCSYTAYYPSAPPPGAYTSAAQVQFQVMGSTGYPSMAQGTTVFNVGVVGGPGLATSAGTIPAGAAMVTDTQAPSGSYMFGGPGQQSFTTQVTCGGGASATGAVSNTATLTAANGQQITQSATVQKMCYDLQLTVASKAAPYVGRWGWSVTKTATPSTLSLRPDAKAFGGAPAGAFGRDYASTTTGDVVYTVTYTRSPPAGFAAGAAAFEASGEVYVQNPAPITARLQAVLVSISNSRGGQAYVTEATCPMLTIGGGQRVTCTWRATPSFNPVGQQVRGIARYINLRNGEPRGATTDFTSAPIVIAGDADAAAAAARNGTGRSLLQTWGGASKATTVGVLPELQPEAAVATTLYGLDGSATVVPSGVADGSSVIVSGGAPAGAGAGPVLAVGGGSAPVILPSGAAAANSRGPAVQEFGIPAGLLSALHQAAGGSGGTAGPSEAAAAALSGLQDECADVADTFLNSNSTVEGRLISGSLPSGRVCGTTTFTYTMRYGPYADCLPRKSVNAATFQTVDTQTRGGSQSDVAISVDGCVNPAALQIEPAKLTTSPSGGYSWTITTKPDVKQLAIGQDATGVATFTVDCKRTGSKAGALLAAEVYVSNPSAYAVPLESATYTVTTMCDGAGKTSSGPVSCADDEVPANGKVLCRVSAGLPCAGHGAYTVVLTAPNGYTVTSAPTPFAFDAEAKAAAAAGECADVKASFLSGDGRVGGAVVSGTRPSGKLCGSRSFTYTVKFGPYSDCSSYKAINSATLLSTGATKSAIASATLPIFVVGCDAYTAESAKSDCVMPASWWRKCDQADDTKCSSGWRLLPGGAANGTLFFPKPNERSARTYGAVLGLATPDTLAPSRRAYIAAAQQFTAAQLNSLSGARLPGLELQETYDALAAFLATSSEGSALAADQVDAISLQTGLLARYNNGTLPSLFKGPPMC